MTILSVSLCVSSSSFCSEGCLQTSSSFSGGCSLCDQQNLYYLNGIRCYKSTESFCSEIDVTGRCIDCQSGFFISKYGSCIPITRVCNCSIYTHNGEISWCSTCDDGYGFVGGSCYPKIPNCDSYTWWGSCSRCVPDYVLTTINSCIKLIPKCIVYFNPISCYTCDSGYGLSFKRDQCLNNIPNCFQYDSNGGCLTCLKNYVPSSTGSSCDPLIPNCLRLDKKNTSTRILCRQCQPGFALSSNSKICQPIIINCVSWNATKNTCDACSTGYVWYLPLRACIGEIKFCQQYINDQSCTSSYLCSECISDYSLSVDKTTCSKIQTCKTDETFCQSKGVCIQIPSCCLTSDGCGNCLTFKINTGWSSKNQVCYVIPVDCLTSFDPDTLKCKCSANQVWIDKSSSCVDIPTCCADYNCKGKCVSFKAGMGWCSATKACYSIPKDCPYNYDCATQTCNCPVGMQWNSSKSECIEVPWCCQTFDDSGNCLTFKLQTGFSKESKSCYNIPLNCQNGYNPTTGACICLNNQTWCAKTSKCVDIPSCCATNDDCGNCLTFKTNTGLCSITNKCYNKPLVCLTNHECDTGRCICDANSIWSEEEGKCILIPTCCKTNDSLGKCVTFKPQTGWCDKTSSCYNIPTDCQNPLNHDCETGACVCPVGQTWCNARLSCVTSLTCCKKSDNCGNCLQFSENKGFCENTKACYDIPTDCSDPSSHDCSTGLCVCKSGQIFNPSTKICVDIPSCCLTWDNLGNCLSFKIGTGWCTITNSCYFIPADCPLSHNCQTSECLCPYNFTWCSAQKKCIEVPSCCETNDTCGACTSVKTGYSICSATKQCAIVPSDCPNSNDGCGNCGCSDPTMTWCPAQKICIGIPSNCIRYDNCGVCLDCKPGFYLVLGKCLPPVVIPHCSQYTTDFQKCQKCDLYYQLTNNDSACYTKDCSDYNISTAICNQCANGFVMVGDIKVCLPEIPECSSYAAFIYGDLLLNCKACRFPYYFDISSNRCVINRCLEYDLTASVLTCKTCINQQLRSPDGYICFPSIEKCLSYSITSTSYKCISCEIGFKLNVSQSLCLSGTYLIGGYGAGAGNGVFTGQGFGVYANSSSASGFSISWGPVDSSSSYYVWYLTSYDGIYYTMRLQISQLGFETPFYLTGNGSDLTITEYFSYADNIKWVIEQVYPGNNVVFYIKSQQSNLYLGYGLTLSSTPTAFYFQ
jgi:hypothetical protein